ncbi:hypothetical protein [Tumebacillus algifaecis]|uniref:hypothetical protein n=1 Tax=Tumebacillus algifaecis TaxID=1214604 RepID=UPI001D132119|nr:hypothetical protein [Tumebacillus algifaecis]
MSQPNIPNITPVIDVTLKQSITLLLSSIAMEELSLAHILNAEAEKIQFLLGTLHSHHHLTHKSICPSDLFELNESVRKTLHEVLKLEMMLYSKLDSVKDLYSHSHHGHHRGRDWRDGDEKENFK